MINAKAKKYVSALSFRRRKTGSGQLAPGLGWEEEKKDGVPLYWPTPEARAVLLEQLKQEPAPLLARRLSSPPPSLAQAPVGHCQSSDAQS